MNHDDMNYIVLYAEDFEGDGWKNYCDICHVPYEAKTITIWFKDDEVQYE